MSKEKILRLRGNKKNMIQLPKKFMKGVLNWRKPAALCCSYSPEKGIAVLAELGAHSANKERILNLLDSSKAQEKGKYPSKEDTAPSFSFTAVEDSLISASGQSSIDDDTMKLALNLFDKIGYVLSKGETAHEILSLINSFVSEHKIDGWDEMFKIADSEDNDEDNVEEGRPLDERDRADKLFEEFFARHPEIDSSKASEKGKYSRLPKESDVFIDSIEFKSSRSLNNTRIGDIPPGGIFAINGDIYLKQHNRSTIRSLINGETLKSNLVNVNFANLAQVPKDKQSRVIKYLTCSPLTIHEAYVVEELNPNDDDGTIEHQILEAHYSKDTTGTEEMHKRIVSYSFVDGEDEFLKLQCSGLDDDRCPCPERGCPTSNYRNCLQDTYAGVEDVRKAVIIKKLKELNITDYDENAEADDLYKLLQDRIYDGCSCGCSPDTKCDNCCEEADCNNTCDHCDSE